MLKFVKMKEEKIIVLEAKDIDVLADLIADRLAVKMSNTSINARAKEDDLIDSKEACRILGCSERTLQRYRDQGLFSVIYRGPHRCYYVRAAILEFRAANTRPSRDMKR